MGTERLVRHAILRREPTEDAPRVKAMPAGATRYAGDLQRRHREVGVADRALRGVLLRWLARQPRIEQVAQRRSRHRVLAQLVARLGGGDTLRGGAEAGGQGTARWQ